MARKKDIARLLAKGLSGTEAGRLAVRHLLEVERGGPGFLTDKDIAGLKTGLRRPADGAAYDRMLDLYRAVCEMLCEAQIQSLQAVSLLRELEHELERYAISGYVCHLRSNLPLLVSAAALPGHEGAPAQAPRGASLQPGRGHGGAHERATRRLGACRGSERAGVAGGLCASGARDRRAHRGRHARAAAPRPRGLASDHGASEEGAGLAAR